MIEQRPVWEVINVADGTMFSGAAGAQRSKVVTVRLNTDGSTFTVEIPLAQFNAQTVQKLITDQIGNELDVRDLAGGPLPPSPS